MAAKDGTVGRATHYVYACQLNEVKAAFGNRKAADLDANTFGKWLHSLRLSVSSKRSIAGVTMTAFRWAELAGLLPSNPLRGFRKPPGVSRGAKAVIPDNTHRRLYAAASPTFKPVLTLLRETGARPSELARLTAADIDLNNGVAVLTDHKTAHTTGRPRIIMLTPEAVGVLRELTAKHPTGPLLRNQRSRPWDKDAIGHAMRRLCKAVGVKAVAYGYRHAFATQALSNGVPDATVAALLGHSSTAMLHKHYSHLTSQAQAMREALLRVRPTA